MKALSGKIAAITLDEACFLDSKAVWFFKQHKLKTKEYKRLKEIRDAKRKKAADRKIKDLTKK